MAAAAIFNWLTMAILNFFRLLTADINQRTKSDANISIHSTADLQ